MRDRLIVTDSAAKTLDAMTDVAKRRFGLTYGTRLKRCWILGEKKSREAATKNDPLLPSDGS